jgi:predicted Zn finger-like uncharacterized protein
MSTDQATRCPNCATVFRVATAQLLAYDGWVRCGRCTEVFNAEECLVELSALGAAAPPSESPALQPDVELPLSGVDFELQLDMPPGPAHSPPPSLRMSPNAEARFGEDNMVERAVKAMHATTGLSPAVDPHWQAHDAPGHARYEDTAPLQVHAARDEAAAFGALPQQRLAEPPMPWQPEPADAPRIEPSLEASTAPGRPSEPALTHALPDDDFTAGPRWPQPAEPAASATASATASAAPVDILVDPLTPALAASQDPPLHDDNLRAHATPSFVRHADRAARWRSPKVQLVLAGVSLLGLLGLTAQVAHEYRDVVAARFAAARPLLEQGCALLNCTVGAPRALDAEGVSVESSGLVRVEKSNTYKLSVALRNRAPTPITLPALELSLTDSQGKLLARRVLRAADFGVTQATVPAGRELSLQATMQTAFTTPNNDAAAGANATQEAVAGYTIELFYP